MLHFRLLVYLFCFTCLFVCLFQIMSRTILVLLVVFLLEQISANELTFELPDNAKECFHEKLKIGSKYILEFQV
jgi:hypothetical protein